MAASNEAINIPLPNEELNKGKTVKEKIRNTLTDELIIGICAPIGSLREEVINEITNILKNEYQYKVNRIKLSDFIKKYSSSKDEIKPAETKAFTFLMNKIVGGNEVRQLHGPSFLVELAIKDIHLSRYDQSKPIELTQVEQLKSRRECFIVDSLKNKEELDLLRELYKDIFYFFSVFSPLEERLDNLRKKGLSDGEAKKIIEKDEHENNRNGQNVRDTFTAGDFFIRISNDNAEKLRDKINRYLNIIFQNKIVTPNQDETAMYEAQSAASNSACLSRQVGAAITNTKGEIVSRGWNDVPKFGGNLYNESDSNDNRCKMWGYCSNDKTKDIITDDILESIFNNPNLVKQLFNNKNIAKDSELYNQTKDVIRKGSRVKDLIEFSRAVHAEMHAIIIGSQMSGDKMIGGKLFCTTYPCHNCARHLVLAGIKEIYYIEPYIKSLCITLHHDSLTENEKDDTKVKLLIYDGVAPRRYLEFFLMTNKRKDEKGKSILEFGDKTNPKTRLSLQALPTLEKQAIISLKDKGIF